MKDPNEWIVIEKVEGLKALLEKEKTLHAEFQKELNSIDLTDQEQNELLKNLLIEFSTDNVKLDQEVCEITEWYLDQADANKQIFMREYLPVQDNLDVSLLDKFLEKIHYLKITEDGQLKFKSDMMRLIGKAVGYDQLKILSELIDKIEPQRESRFDNNIHRKPLVVIRNPVTLYSPRTDEPDFKKADMENLANPEKKYDSLQSYIRRFEEKPPALSKSKINLGAAVTLFYIADRKSLSLKAVNVGGDCEVSYSPSFINVSHEFTHIIRCFNGEFFKWLLPRPAFISELYTDIEELFTIKKDRFSENFIRSSIGLPERLTHRGGGVFKIIDKNQLEAEIDNYKKKLVKTYLKGFKELGKIDLYSNEIEKMEDASIWAQYCELCFPKMMRDLKIIEHAETITYNPQSSYAKTLIKYPEIITSIKNKDNDSDIRQTNEELYEEIETELSKLGKVKVTPSDNPLEEGIQKDLLALEEVEEKGKSGKQEAPQPVAVKPLNELYGAFQSLEKVGQYSNVVHDNSWATDEGIHEVLTYYLNYLAHIIEPSASSVYTPLSSVEGLKQYGERINGYVSDDGELQSNGFIQDDGGELKKPIIMIINTEAAHAESSVDTESVGGNHWVTCVILPKAYTILGQQYAYDTEQVFYIDSLNKEAPLPEAFKSLLTEGLTYEGTRQPSDEEQKQQPGISEIAFTHQILPAFPNTIFHDDLTALQQLGGDDCGWWAVYNALMVVHTGGASFLEMFAKRARADGLRELLPNLAQGSHQSSYAQVLSVSGLGLSTTSNDDNDVGMQEAMEKSINDHDMQQKQQQIQQNFAELQAKRGPTPGSLDNNEEEEMEFFAESEEEVETDDESDSWRTDLSKSEEDSDNSYSSSNSSLN